MRRYWGAAFTLCLFTTITSPAVGFAPTAFLGAARSAPTILLGQFTKLEAKTATVQVIRLLHGKASIVAGKAKPTLEIGQANRLYERPSPGFVYLILLTSNNEPFQTKHVCGTYNTLEVVDNAIPYPQQFDPTWDRKKVLSLSEAERILKQERDRPSMPDNLTAPAQNNYEAEAMAMESAVFERDVNMAVAKGDLRFLCVTGEGVYAPGLAES